MGRKSLPTAWKIINGNPGHRPLNENEPKPPVARPEPPPFLTEDGVAEWNYVIDNLVNVGLMTALDRAALAAYCQAFAMWVQATKTFEAMKAKDPLTGALMVKTSNGNAIQNPVLGTLNRLRDDVVRYAAEFGMTPSARSRLDVGIGSLLTPASGSGERASSPAHKFF